MMFVSLPHAPYIICEYMRHKMEYMRPEKEYMRQRMEYMRQKT